MLAPVHEVRFELVSGLVSNCGTPERRVFHWNLEVVTGESALALRTLDTLYDQHRMSLSLRVTLDSGLHPERRRTVMFRYAVVREVPGKVHATTEGSGSREILGDVRAALDVLDRGWLLHREHLARFAAQARI